MDSLFFQQRDELVVWDEVSLFSFFPPTQFFLYFYNPPSLLLLHPFRSDGNVAGDTTRMSFHSLSLILLIKTFTWQCRPFALARYLHSTSAAAAFGGHFSLWKGSKKCCFTPETFLQLLSDREGCEGIDAMGDQRDEARFTDLKLLCLCRLRCIFKGWINLIFVKLSHVSVALSLAPRWYTLCIAMTTTCMQRESR